MTTKLGRLVLITCLAWSTQIARAESLVEPFLVKGQLAEGAIALQARLKAEPQDDQARFGLGVIQFLQTFEHLGTSLYRHGLRTERALLGAPWSPSPLVPQNPTPEELSHAQLRKILQTILDDLKQVETTLATVKDPQVKLPLPVDQMKVDLFGLRHPVDARMVMSLNAPQLPIRPAPFYVAFDRGDVNWLRGYCHIVSAFVEGILAVDTQELFECSAHLFFEKVTTPHTFLLEGERAFSSVTRFDQAMISDVIAFLHLWRYPVKEPERMLSALSHLEAALGQAREMWKHYQSETDDDREWIPNPRQTGVMGMKITAEMVELWLSTLDEADLILQGKRLVPFWRHGESGTGLNFRRVFTEPKTLDPFLWWQGTAATPYLEKGPLSKLSDRELQTRLNTIFGSNFFRFAFWVN